ncbi:hypothetical protein GCK32_016676, partial [Trichostrongylus colubriformis]
TVRHVCMARCVHSLHYPPTGQLLQRLSLLLSSRIPMGI